MPLLRALPSATLPSAAALLSAALLLSGPAVAGEIQVDSAYARAVAPGQSTSAVFMQLRNTGPDALRLTQVESSAATAAELHNHVHHKGVMQMRRIDHIELPSHQPVSLAPGGLHIMLIGLTRALNEGDTLEMRLHYSDGSEQLLELPVQGVVPVEQDTHQSVHHSHQH